MKEMKMKKILSLLMCLLLLVFFTACFADTSDDTDDNAEDTTPKKTTDDKIDDMIADMSLEEQVGQMFIVRCPSAPTDTTAVSEYHLGAYILFARDFENYTADQVKANIESYQGEAKIPMLIGVDEEGGTVNRVSSYPQFRSTPFQSPRDLFAEGGMDAINKDAQEKCELLSSLGINLNFAPVCDISTNTTDFMYKRSLGQDPATIGAYAKSMVEIGLENHMGSVLKHFPGYGNNKDTHTGIAYDNRDMATFQNNDFIPFEEGIKGGSTCILVSHNIVNCMDADNPASLSSAVHDIIRNEINFDGVIMTDDLSMGAIVDFCGAEAAAVTAVKAGNDMLCVDDYTEQIPAVINAVNNGDIDVSQIEASVHRILKWKYDLGLLDI